MNKLIHSSGLPCFMGILNLTGDSFSDGGLFLDPVAALEHVKRMVASGAGIIDIGAESTRPGAMPVPLGTELDRILPVLKAIRKFHPQLCISIDTRKAEVASKCISHGAKIINDISGLSYDPEMIKVIRDNSGVKVILMHMQGEPQTMQQNPQYTDVVDEVAVFFAELIARCEHRGIKRKNVMVDPGIGFGKNLEHNLELLANLDCIAPPDIPVVLGASRKSFINEIDPSQAMERIGGSLASTAWGIIKGVQIIRVHDVKEHVQFAKVFMAIAKQEKITECPF